MRKRKLITALASLCAVLFVSVVGMGIWAASNQTVTSTINVTYSVHDVVCTVTANKYVNGNNTAVGFTGGDDNGATKTFNAKTAQSTVTLSTPSTALTSTYDYVVYEYIIHNTGSGTMTAALAITNESRENVNVYTRKETSAALTNPYTSLNLAAATNDEPPVALWAESNAISSTTIEANGYLYAYVVVKITDCDFGASFAETFTWTLADVPAV